MSDSIESCPLCGAPLSLTKNRPCARCGYMASTAAPAGFRRRRHSVLIGFGIVAVLVVLCAAIAGGCFWAARRAPPPGRARRSPLSKRLLAWPRPRRPGYPQLHRPRYRRPQLGQLRLHPQARPEPQGLAYRDLDRHTCTDRRAGRALRSRGCAVHRQPLHRCADTRGAGSGAEHRARSLRCGRPAAGGRWLRHGHSPAQRQGPLSRSRSG